MRSSAVIAPAAFAAAVYSQSINVRLTLLLWTDSRLHLCILITLNHSDIGLHSIIVFPFLHFHRSLVISSASTDSLFPRTTPLHLSCL